MFEAFKFPSLCACNSVFYSKIQLRTNLTRRSFICDLFNLILVLGAVKVYKGNKTTLYHPQTLDQLPRSLPSLNIQGFDFFRFYLFGIYLKTCFLWISNTPISVYALNLSIPSRLNKFHLLWPAVLQVGLSKSVKCCILREEVSFSVF